MSEQAPTTPLDPRAFLRMLDMVAASPVGPPEVVLYHESPVIGERGKEWMPGYWQSQCCVESLLIDEGDLEKCKLAPIYHFDHVTDPFKVDCYEGPPAYLPGEQAELFCEEAGMVSVEPVYFDQLWDGLHGKCLIEPSQRLTLYLELEQRPGPDAVMTEWVDPYDGRVVVKRRDAGTRLEERHLTIRLNRLRDYLAARGTCLYVRRWSERFFTLQDDQLDQFQHDSSENVDSGIIHYERREILGARSVEAILNQHFLIRPAARPSHYKLRDHRNEVPPVEFLDEQGDPIKPDSRVHPLSVISFRRQALDQFRSNVDGGWGLQSIAPGTMWLIFPRGQSLHVSDSPHGQIQCFLKDLHDLDHEYQEYMRGFCEMFGGRPHPNWLLPSMGYGPPVEEPHDVRLNTAKRRLCNAVSRVAADSPFACAADPVRSADVVRPHPDDGPEFARVCKEVYRKLLVENRPDDFIRVFGLNVDKDGRSIAAMKAFADKYASEKAEHLIRPFRALNGFRQVDAHPKSMDGALRDSGYDQQQDFGACFDRLLSELCGSLETIAVLVGREVTRIEEDSSS